MLPSDGGLTAVEEKYVAVPMAQAEPYAGEDADDEDSYEAYTRSLEDRHRAANRARQARSRQATRVVARDRDRRAAR